MGRSPQGQNCFVSLCILIAVLGLSLKLVSQINFKSIINTKKEITAKSPYIRDTPKKQTTTIRPTSSIKESFFDFLYKFIQNKSFRKSRTVLKLDDAQDELMEMVLSYGTFVNSDSTKTHWIYTSKYKGSSVHFVYVIKEGQWFLQYIRE